MRDEKFEEWKRDLEERESSFMMQTVVYGKEDDFWIHRNCIFYDNEIRRLRQFKHPCSVCNMPLHLNHNYQIFEVGDVCLLCHSLYTIITEYVSFVTGKHHFRDLHEEWRKKQKRGGISGNANI